MAKRFISLILFIFFGLSGGCAAIPPDRELIRFQTASPVWLDQAGMPAHKSGRGNLILPSGRAAPFPAVIILHSSLGIGSLEWSLAESLKESGIASFVVDSFGPRGVSRITDNQARVSEASILWDLFAAYDTLRADPRIDGHRIAVAGFSKGGLPAIYSGFKEIRNLYGRRDVQFAAHLAFYPWCGLALNDMATMKEPMQIHIGGDDNVTPATLCRDMEKRVRAAGGNIDLHVYDDARHGFDNPVLLNTPPLGVSYNIPSQCRIVEKSPGVFVETHSGMEVTSDSFADALSACSEKGGWVGGNRDAAETARGAALAFLKKHLNVR